MIEAARLREQAVEAANSGRLGEAARLHGRAVELAGSDVSILNSAAFFFSRNGESERAIAILQRAIEADRAAAEPLFNLALILTNEGRAAGALALLVEREQHFRGVARYWTIRAGAERKLRHKREALSSFEAAARVEPGNALAAHGRARMALETGRPAIALYRSVVGAQSGDLDAWLGYTQALDAEGRSDEARALLETAVVQQPMWIDAHEMLARLCWAAGDVAQFASTYAVAAAAGGNAALYASWSKSLAGVDLHARAAEVAAEAQRVLGASEAFALLEAECRGEAGDDARAETIFARLALQSAQRWLSEAGHRLRRGDAAAAEALCAQVIAGDAGHVAAWALRAIAWRLLGDARSEWLHGQSGLVAAVRLDLGEAELARLGRYLDRLHDQSAVPIDQSVRGGTQTRGGLFDRHEPEARAIEQAFGEVIATYRAGLPTRDDGHPLLRHRDAAWRIEGSWSIRMVDAGHHVQHIHPHGLISSAAYFAVPASAADQHARAGWLELGRPPAGLRVNLEPEAMIEPRVGQCVLFPSTMYHGTRPFPAGKRMSVAIDVNRERER